MLYSNEFYPAITSANVMFGSIDLFKKNNSDESIVATPFLDPLFHRDDNYTFLGTLVRDECYNLTFVTSIYLDEVLGADGLLRLNKVIKSFSIDYDVFYNEDDV